MVVRITVRYFGYLYEFLGVFQDVVIVRGRDKVKVKDVLVEVEKLRPELRSVRERVPMLWFFKNGRQVHENEEVVDGDVLWIMPTMYEGG